MIVKLEDQDVSLFSLRMRQLVDDIKLEHLNLTKGHILLLSDYEEERHPFRQESSFYYLTGIQEPGAAALIDLNGKATLFMPQFSGNRKQWVYEPYELTQPLIERLGFHEVQSLGAPCTGYQSHPFFDKQDYAALLERLESAGNSPIFTLNPSSAYGYVYQRMILNRLSSFLPNMMSRIIDISPIVAHLRRGKDMHEIETMYRAVAITCIAQEAAAQAIGDNVEERYVQAALEYAFTASGAQKSFPSIVGSGKHSTILHYNVNNSVMKNGDLVVVDIGAEYNYYCADLTRTYPVSGKFTPRQREIYSVVLETQEYIASIAKPGMWLSNKDQQDQSLNHLAHKYIDERGYGNYFPHNIGHFLGLDVHDVGDYLRPLQEGDVITIEPGIYISEEALGVRIEDNYWIVQDGVVCLSEDLPKKPEEIEEFMKNSK